MVELSEPMPMVRTSSGHFVPWSRQAIVNSLLKETRLAEKFFSVRAITKEEAEAIKWFREKCGEPKVIDCGDEIYYDDTLYVGFEFYAGNRDNWEVA